MAIDITAVCDLREREAFSVIFNDLGILKGLDAVLKIF